MFLNKKGVKKSSSIIKLDYFEQQKTSLANNAEAYIDMILEAIYECFCGLSENDTDLEGTPIAGDKFLFDICCILHPRKWILLESFPPIIDSIELYFEKNILSLERVFLQFEDILRQANPSINKFVVQNECMSILNFCLQQLQVHLHAPCKLWQFIFPMKEKRDWCYILTIIELCVCTPCSNAELERFLSQMRVVKTDWRNRLSQVNLIYLFRIKVGGPSLKLFHDNYCHLAIDLWFNKKERRLGQKRCKNYRKRKSKKKKVHSESLTCHHYWPQNFLPLRYIVDMYISIII